MKIAFIGTEGIPGNYGGFETFVDNISYRLTKRNHEVTVFQPFDYQVELKNTKYKDIIIKYVKCPKNKYFRAIIKRLNSFKIIRKGEFDIIHNFGAIPFIFKLFNEKGITVATLDGFEWKRHSYNFLFKKYLKWSFNKSAKFPEITITDSKIIHDYYLNRGIKTEYLPYGCNFINEPQKLKKKFLKLGIKKRHYIYFEGRFVREKNIHRLILDFQQTNTKKNLVLIGKGINGELYENYLKNLAKVDKRIIFTGPLYGDDYFNIISNADGYVSTSLLEGTSPALLDALGAKQKVLIGDIPENRSTLNNLGYYYPLYNPHLSVRNLEKFLKGLHYSKVEYIELMNFVRKTYDWENIVNKYIKIISD